MKLPAKYFTNNIYYTKYIKLLESDYTKSNYQFEKHHLIPVCYYKYLYNCKDRKQAEIYANNDSDNEIIMLPFPYHVLAHYYLCECCMNKTLKHRLVSAFLFLVSFKNKYNTYLSKTDIEILEEAATQYKEKQKDCFGKQVLCIETGIIYPNVSAANEAMNMDRYTYMGIYDVCKHIHNQQIACGYHWCYSNDSDSFNKLTKYYLTNVKSKAKTAGKKIYCVELDRVFNSANEAGQFFSKSRSQILYCCGGSWRTIEKFHLCYLEEKDTFKISEKPKKTAEQKAYISLKTKEAMRRISQAQKRKMKENVLAYWGSGKYHYFNNGNDEIRAANCPDGWIAGRLQKYKTKGKKIICIELNKQFDSAAAASKLLNISSNSISNCLNLRTKTAGGYHWKFVENNNK